MKSSYLIIFLLNCIFSNITNSFAQGAYQNVQLAWLAGFTNCTNVLAILLPNKISFTLSQELNNPLIILENSDIDNIENIKIFSTKWTTCRSFSILFSPETTESVESTLLKLAHNVSTINPTQKRDYKTYSFSLKRYLFMVPININNQSISADRFENYFKILHMHVHESHDFIVNLSDDDGTELTYLCALCPAKSEEAVLVKVNRTRNNNPRNYLADAESSVKLVNGQGRNVLWVIPQSLFKFPLNSRKLNYIGGASIRNILTEKPHFDEIILSILMHKMKYEILYRHLGSSKSFPWACVSQGTFSGYHTISIGLDGFNFITCDGLNRVISFSAYAKPFSQEVWLGLILSLTGSTVLMVLIANVLKLRGLSYVSVFFTIYALLMETDVFMGKMSRSRQFRMFLGIWLFGTLILSTAYKGDNIASVIVPDGQDKMYSSFAQLGNFTLFTPSLYGAQSGLLEARMSFLGFSFGIWLMDLVGFRNSSRIKNLTVSDEEIMKEWNISEHNKTIAALYNNIKVIDLTNQNEMIGNVLDVIGNCDKSAFVSDLNQISVVLKGLRNTNTKFYEGERPFLFEDFASWKFGSNGGEYMPRKMNSLMASGILEMWKGLLGNDQSAAASSDGRTSSDSIMKPLSMNSNLSTIFLIFIFGSAFTIVVFVLEKVIVDSSKSNVHEFEFI